MAALSFVALARSRRQAPRPLRERLECSEGGDTGRRTLKSYRTIKFRPSVQPPAGVERKNRPYTRPARKGKTAVNPALGRVSLECSSMCEIADIHFLPARRLFPLT